MQNDLSMRPDDAIWDLVRSRAIVMHNQGGTVALIDVANAKVTASIRVAPGPESAALDKRGLLWVNSGNCQSADAGRSGCWQGAGTDPRRGLTRMDARQIQPILRR